MADLTELSGDELKTEAEKRVEYAQDLANQLFPEVEWRADLNEDLFIVFVAEIEINGWTVTVTRMIDPNEIDPEQKRMNLRPSDVLWRQLLEALTIGVREWAKETRDAAEREARRQQTGSAE